MLQYPPVKMVQFAGDAYSEGIEIVERDQVKLRVYCVAKTVADCFKHRNKIGFDVALEALKDAREKKKASADDLWRFAKVSVAAPALKSCLTDMPALGEVSLVEMDDFHAGLRTGWWESMKALFSPQAKR